MEALFSGLQKGHFVHLLPPRGRIQQNQPLSPDPIPPHPTHPIRSFFGLPYKQKIYLTLKTRPPPHYFLSLYSLLPSPNSFFHTMSDVNTSLSLIREHPKIFRTTTPPPQLNLPSIVGGVTPEYFLVFSHPQQNPTSLHVVFVFSCF